MNIHIEALSSANKKLESAIVDMRKQAAIHTPGNYYLPPELYRAAITAAARDAANGKSDVELYFKGVLVKPLAV